MNDKKITFFLIDVIIMIIFSVLSLSTLFLVIFNFYILLKSIVGIILFITAIVNRNLLFSKKRLVLLIPSIIVSCFILYSTALDNMSDKWLMIIPGLGMPLWMTFWVLNENNIIKDKLKYTFCIITPISFFISYILSMAFIGI